MANAAMGQAGAGDGLLVNCLTICMCISSVLLLPAQ